MAKSQALNTDKKKDHLIRWPITYIVYTVKSLSRIVY